MFTMVPASVHPPSTANCGCQQDHCHDIFHSPNKTMTIFVLVFSRLEKTETFLFFKCFTYRGIRIPCKLLVMCKLLHDLNFSCLFRLTHDFTPFHRNFSFLEFLCLQLEETSLPRPPPLLCTFFCFFPLPRYTSLFIFCQLNKYLFI